MGISPTGCRLHREATGYGQIPLNVSRLGENFPGERVILLLVMATAALGRPGSFFMASSTDLVEGILALGCTRRGFVAMVASPLLYPLVMAGFAGSDCGLMFFVGETHGSQRGF
jgi:hypothetical protein